MIEKVRAAIKDRATWFYLIYKSFKEVMSDEEVEKQLRKAIFQFGRLKAKSDPENFSPAAWVQRHKEKGSALVFDSDIEIKDDCAVQQMKFCPLVEAWKDLGCDDKEIELLCDIAMEGDRGRADGHGVRMELNERISKKDHFCNLVIFNQ